MNINKVYLCDVYRLVDIVYSQTNDDVLDSFNLDRFLGIRREVSFEKSSLVYYSQLHKCYIDLETKENYSLGSRGCTIGSLFIASEKMVPITSIIGSEKKNMSKRRILNKYKDAKDEME